MSLFITSLNSGSNGNCYYIGNSTEAVLVDAGISCREIEKRMTRLGLNIQKIKAIFISHEHSDHICGLRTLVKRYKIPVYITAGTLSACRFTLEPQLVKSFSSDETVNVGSLTITAFKKHHDAHDPYSFTISCNNVHVGVFTDIGTPCSQLTKHFKQCHAAFLEANYDEEMLDKGDYPYHLKRRIRGGNGHLSNKQALEIFTSHRAPHLTHLLLAHLSKNNNCPQLVKELFTQHANGVEVVVASRYEETPVYHITAGIESTKVVTRRTTAPQLAFEFV
jgi:phosphoribosyl 1,2-cyclic phosphodiesterase